MDFAIKRMRNIDQLHGNSSLNNGPTAINIIGSSKK